MEAIYKANALSPSGQFEIIYGEAFEYGMGGPYASSIYLKEIDRPPFLISSQCYGDVYFTDDESCIYFLYLTIERKLQMKKYIIESRKLITYKEIYDSATIKNANNYGYTLEVKYDATKSDFQPYLANCDTKSENVESENTIQPIIRIVPEFGIEMVNFGDDRKTIIQRLKDAESFPDRKIDFFTSYGFHIHYNENDKVEFIEIMGDMQSTFELYGVNPFKYIVEQLIQLITEKNNGAINIINAPEDYLFLEIDLGLFRNSTPEKFLAYIEQSKLDDPDSFKNGTPDWMLEDLAKTKYIQTIGLGNKGYFRNPIYSTKN